MSAAFKLKALAANAASAPAPAPAPKTASSAASSVVPPAVPKTVTKAAPKAATKAASSDCAEFKAGKVCHRGQHCRDINCRRASNAAAAASSPKSSGKGGDGGVAAAAFDAAAMEARLNRRLDGIEAKVESGFNEQRQMSLQLQKQGNEAYAKTMRMFEMFGNMMTGGGAAMAPRPELPAPPMRPAICAPATTTRSTTITEMHDERPSARGGGCATEGGKSSGLTGTEIDNFMQACAKNGLLPEGTLFKALREICEKTGLSEYHHQLISSIGKITNNDNLAALLFLLLTGSKQFRKGSFGDFRTSCDGMLGSNRAHTCAAFSKVCDHMLKGMRDWQITKKGGISVSNADLKDASNRTSVFNELVTNFQS